MRNCCSGKRPESQAVLVDGCAPHLQFKGGGGITRELNFKSNALTSRILLMCGHICHEVSAIQRKQLKKAQPRACCVLTESSNSRATTTGHSMCTTSPLPTCAPPVHMHLSVRARGGYLHDALDAADSVAEGASTERGADLRILRANMRVSAKAFLATKVPGTRN